MVKIDMEMPKSCSECEFYIGYNGAMSIGDKCKRLPIKDMDGDFIDYQVICKTLDKARKLLKSRDKKCPLQEVKEWEDGRK